MSEKVTFIHAADLHLGAPFRGLRAVSEQWASRLLEALPQAYERVVEEAINQNVDFVVIAGDVFDQAHPSYADFICFIEGLERLNTAGIPVYLCTGNHDPYVSWTNDFAELPPNTHMFSADKPGFMVHERDGVPCTLLCGRGYYNTVVSDAEDIASGITRDAAQRALGCTAPFAVGVLHTGLNLATDKAPTNPDELYASGLDYWALGHIHKTWLDDKANPRIAFSGCIQGRDIKEIGPRGVFKVVLEQGLPNKVEFIPTACVVWQMMDVDVSECTTVAQVQESIVARLFVESGRAHCNNMVERITLKGRTQLHDILAKPGILEDMRALLNEGYPSFFCDALIDETTAPRDTAAVKKEGLFPSALLAQADQALASSDRMVEYLQNEFLDQGLILPKSVSMNIDNLIEQARENALDALDSDGAS